MFQAVQGAKFAEDLFPTYRLPDGCQMHYYHKGRRLVDEVPAYWERLRTPANLEDIFQEALPYLDGLVNVLQTVSIDLLTEPEDMEGAEHELVFPGRPPRPRCHTLMGTRKHTCHEGEEMQCESHGVLDPVPFVVVAQLSALPVSTPPLAVPEMPVIPEEEMQRSPSPKGKRKSNNKK